MTVPFGNPTQIPFIDGITPAQAWAGVSGQTDYPVLLNNTDSTNTVYAGYQNNITVGGTNTTPIPPLTSITMSGIRTIYVIAPAGTTPLEVTPGGSNPTASPTAVAEAFITSGIALAIAQAISGSGISLVGAPVLLYNVSSVQPSSNAALVGFTNPDSSLQPNCFNGGLSQSQADARSVSLVSRGSTGGHLTVTKKFWQVSDWSLTKNDLANYVTFGTRVIAAIKPLVYTGLPANSNFTTAASLTAAQKAAAVAEISNLQGWLTGMQGLGFTATTLVVVPWHEPEINLSANDFGNMLLTYGPTINASIFPLIIDIGSGKGAAVAQNLVTAAFGVAGVTLAGVAQDMYPPAWLHQGFTPDILGGMADAHVPPLPYGLYEIGTSPARIGQQAATNYLLGNHATGGQFGVLDYMQSRLQAGKKNLDVIYYEGACVNNGSDGNTSPIGLDPTVVSPDFRISIYQQLFDTLTAAPPSAFTINPGITATPAALSPSPVGLLAACPELSYEITLGLTAGAASTNPFARVTLRWFDFDQTPANQQLIDEVDWYIPMGTTADPNGPVIMFGSGRMRGAFMQLRVTNLDTVQCTLNFCQIAGTGRIGKRDEWLWDVNPGRAPVIPGFTGALSATGTLQIGRISSTNIASGGTVTRLNGLFAGAAYLRIFESGAAANNTVNFTLACQPTGSFGTSNLINENVGNSQQEQIFRIDLPRCTTAMTIKNNDANPVNVDYQLIGEQTS